MLDTRRMEFLKRGVVMNKVIKAQKKLKRLYEEKHKRDAIFQAFGFCQCHQLDWEIRHTINLLKEVLL